MTDHPVCRLSRTTLVEAKRNYGGILGQLP
jgi:hypothetical protein